MPIHGQPLRIYLTASRQEFYTSRLIEASSESFFIDLPLHHKDNTAAPFTPELWVEYHAHDGALSRFPARLIGTERIPTPVWKITRPKASDIEREQRREFVRVPADLVVHMEYTGEGAKQRADVRTRDISGGGMLVALPRNVVVRTGSIVRCRFTLPNIDFQVDVDCLVVRVSERNEFGFAMSSMQFLGIKEPVRQRIIQYTFWRQRSLK